MKKTLIALMALAGVACAAEPTPVALWNGFESTTSGDYSLVTSGSSSINNGVLNVVGAANGTATVDLTGKGLNFQEGVSVAMWVTDFTYGTSNKYPAALLSFAAEHGDINNNNNYYALAGIGLTTKDGQGGFACMGSTGACSNANRADISFLADSTPDLVVATFASDAFTLYVNGDIVATGTPTGTGDKQLHPDYALTKLSIGSWSGNSGLGASSETIHSLAIYNSTLTTAQVKSLSIPEPATATLSLLALAGLAARRRRH